MLDILRFALDCAWKILAIWAGWTFFRYIVRNGKGTIRDLLETVGIGVKAGTIMARRKLANYLKKEAEPKEKEDDGRQVEARIV